MAAARIAGHEKELLGFYVTGHPLTPFAPILEKYAVHNTSQLGELANRAMTRIGGLVVECKKAFLKKSGKPYAMVTLEDLEGSVQILCLNENYDKFINLLVPKKALLVTGEVNLSEDKPKIFPQEIIPLEDAPHLYQASASAPANGAPDGRDLEARGNLPAPSRQMPACFFASSGPAAKSCSSKDDRAGAHPPFRRARAGHRHPALWPDAQFAAGPPVENGFYYDVELAHRISPEDFEKIEAEMKKEIKANNVSRKSSSRASRR
jgi:hypothetical protein